MLLKWNKDDLMNKGNNKIKIRGFLDFASYFSFPIIVNQKYFDLEGSCESHNLIEIPFEDIYEYYMDYDICLSESYLF